MKRLALAVLAATLFAQPALASHPDFSGHWQLDVAASDFGKSASGKPRERTDVMAHRDPILVVHSRTVRAAGDTLALDYRYRTSGESVNEVMGQDVHTTASWDGKALRLETHTKLLLLDIAVKERWSLSADGHRLTEERSSALPTGELRQKLVFTRR